MSSTSNNEKLIIRVKERFPIDKFQVEIIDHLGLLTADVHYFKVKFLSDDSDTISNKFGLLRVGSVEGSLNRELQLRETLGSYGMVAELLDHTTKKSVLINPPSSLNDLENNQEEQQEISTTEENTESTIDNGTDLNGDKNAIFNEEEKNNKEEVLNNQEIDELSQAENPPDTIRDNLRL